jgi:hypothetical protein
MRRFRPFACGTGCGRSSERASVTWSKKRHQACEGTCGEVKLRLRLLASRLRGGVARTTRRLTAVTVAAACAAPRRKSRRVASRYLGRVEIPSCPAVFRMAPARPEGLRTSTSGL